VTTSYAVLAGVLLTAGMLALAVALLPATPRLIDALDRLDPDGPLSAAEPIDLTGLTRSDRLGSWVVRRLRLRVSDRTRTALRLQGRTVAEFYGDKAALALTGAVLPTLIGFMAGYAFDIPLYVPAIAAPIGAVIGFFVPDLQLSRTTKSAQSSAVESLLTFIDLVTLERLANASATQALHNAAQVSDAPLFVQMRTALERARLEQHSPYGELRRLADELGLPELNDVADVMQLDESGAALSGALRARVRELRDAHLSREQIEASAAAEGMTIYMTLPALVFGAIFMVAALMRLVGT
jgi:Flp pilus assembly protein TadB